MNKSLQPLMMALPVGHERAYIQSVNQVPILTAEEENDLANRLFYENDLEAAKRLVLSHLRFVVRIARGYKGYGLALSDLIQEGNIGLMKAVRRFNPEMGVRLVSFAVHWIKAEIHEFVIRNWRIVKIATTKAQRKLFFNLRKASKRLGWFTNDEKASIARDLNVSVKEVELMEVRLNAHDTAFDMPAVNDDQIGYGAPSQYLEDKRANPAVLVEYSDFQRDRSSRFHKALKQLDVRSRDILTSRWLAEKKATLHNLAAKYGVSAERIRQIEQIAMTKLRVELDEVEV